MAIGMDIYSDGMDCIRFLSSYGFRIIVSDVLKFAKALPSHFKDLLDSPHPTVVTTLAFVVRK